VDDDDETHTQKSGIMFLKVVKVNNRENIWKQNGFNKTSDIKTERKKRQQQMMRANARDLKKAKDKDP
jgi:hypothetical protein